MTQHFSEAKQFFAFQWHITDECDQRCKHCYIFSGDVCKKLDSMSWAQMEDTFYNCLDFCEVYGRLPYFYLTGGDPILHPDFWRLLALFKKHNVPFTIMGNPFHLNDQVCREMKYYGCEKYQLSLDGLHETHDWFRKPGSFDCTMEKIGCINRSGIRSVIMTTVSKTNHMEVPGIIDAVVAAGADPEAEIGEDHDPETHLIPLVLDAASGKRPDIKVFGTDYPTRDGSCIRDYIHVEDLASAHILALEYLNRDGKSDFFNLGNEQGTSVLEVIEAARKVTGKEFQVTLADRRPGDPAVLVGSSEKAREVLGWKQEYKDIDIIVRHAWGWHKR